MKHAKTTGLTALGLVIAAFFHWVNQMNGGIDVLLSWSNGHVPFNIVVFFEMVILAGIFFIVPGESTRPFELGILGGAMLLIPHNLGPILAGEGFFGKVILPPQQYEHAVSSATFWTAIGMLVCGAIHDFAVYKDTRPGVENDPTEFVDRDVTQRT